MAADHEIDPDRDVFLATLHGHDVRVNEIGIAGMMLAVGHFCGTNGINDCQWGQAKVTTTAAIWRLRFTNPGSAMACTIALNHYVISHEDVLKWL